MSGSLKWLVFASISLMLTMMNIDFSGVVLALPSIAKDLHSNLTPMQWVINGYAIAAAAFVLFGGCLGDIYGRVRFYFVGIGLFVLAVFLIGISTTQTAIIFFRVVQGIGAAISWPLGIVLIKNAFPPEQQGFSLGLAAMVMGLSISIGPPVIGIILHLFNW